MNLFKKYEQLNKLSSANFLEESPQISLIAWAIFTLCGIVFALIVWASLSTIKESSKTFGELVPVGNVRKIQHLEGGIVKQVLVDNGQTVKPGQLLAKIDNTANLAELEKSCSYEINLLLDKERLEAFIENRRPNKESWKEELKNSTCKVSNAESIIDSRIDTEASQLESELQQRIDQVAILKLQLNQQETLYEKFKEQLVISEKHVSLLQQEFEMYQKLKVNNYVSHRDYLAVLRQLNEGKGEQEQIRSEIKRLGEAIGEYKGKIQELNETFLTNAKKELGEVNDKLLEVQHQINKLRTSVVQSNIYAPIEGVIKGVTVFAGNVVQPGGLLMEIVPEHEPLIAETRIDPKDIGYIKVGSPVIVKITSYNYSRYGGINGTLTEISASTFLDNEGKPFYKARITLPHQYIVIKNQKMPLKAGMTAEADIITGEKTLMQYLLRPIQQSASTAFSER